MSIWHRFLALFCCLSVQTNDRVPRLTVLCEPALVKWVNRFLSSSGEKIAKFVDLAKDLRFVHLVAAVTNVDISSLKKKHLWKKRKRSIHKAIACLAKLDILKEGEFSASKIAHGNCDEMRGVVLKLLAWYMNSKNNNKMQEVNDSQGICQMIESGAPRSVDGKDNQPLKRSLSVNLNLKSAQNEKLPETSTIPRSVSCPLITSDKKICSREIIEPLVVELTNAAVAVAKNANEG